MVYLQEGAMLSKLVRFSILLLLIKQLTATSKDIDATVQIVSNADVEKLLAKYPNVMELSPRILKKQNKGRGPASVTLNYRLGDHVLGETCVVHKSHSYKFATYQSVSIQAHYPAAESNTKPSIVTYVDIVVQQSNYEGRAYVVDGGIGQREILFVIEANNTNFLIYDIDIYGVN